MNDRRAEGDTCPGHSFSGHCRQRDEAPGEENAGAACDPFLDRTRRNSTQKRVEAPEGASTKDVSAATYSPTPSPGQYHRRWRA
jgi:hypothetical protein